MMMDVGNEKGVIESSQMEMINNVFEFDDTTASDVMTHRTNIVAVPRTARISDVVYLAVNEGFSRIPFMMRTSTTLWARFMLRTYWCW